MALTFDEVRSFIIDTMDVERVELSDETQDLIAQGALLHMVNARTDGAFFDLFDELAKKAKALFGDR